MEEFKGPDSIEILWLESARDSAGNPTPKARYEEIPRDWARVDENDLAADAIRTADKLEHLSYLKRLVKESFENHRVDYRIWRDKLKAEYSSAKLPNGKSPSIDAVKGLVRCHEDYPGWYAVENRLVADEAYLADYRRDMGDKLAALKAVLYRREGEARRDPRN